MPDMKAKYNRCRKLAQTFPKTDRNKEPPKCRLCPYYQPEFKYRKCLFAICPYGKNANIAFRKRPLKEEKIVMGGG